VVFSATSSGFGYGYEAVRIRVKPLFTEIATFNSLNNLNTFSNNVLDSTESTMLNDHLIDINYKYYNQVRLTSVLVSWDGLVTRIECADQFLGMLRNKP
jgi:hypothetical protein